MSAYRTEFHSSLEVVPPDTPQVFLPQAVSDPSQAPQVVPLPDKFATVSDTPIYTNDYKHDGSIPPPVDAEAASNKAKNNGKIMGMRRTTFWLVSFLVVLVLGGAIGGGVGATVGKKMNTEASSSSKPETASPGANASSTPSANSVISSVSTTAPYTIAASPTVAPTSEPAQPTSTPNAQAVVAGCPGVNNTIYTAITGRDRFLKVCALEMPGPAIDITSYNTTTFDACIDKCAQLNFDNNNSTCVAVTWDLRSLDYKICYLKHTIGAWRTQGEEDSYLVTGLLIGR